MGIPVRTNSDLRKIYTLQAGKDDHMSDQTGSNVSAAGQEIIPEVTRTSDIHGKEYNQFLVRYSV